MSWNCLGLTPLPSRPLLTLCYKELPPIFTFFLPARLLLGHFSALVAAETRQMLLYKITQEHTRACCFQHLENLTFKYANILWHEERKRWKVTFERKHTRDVSKLEFTLLDRNWAGAIITGEYEWATICHKGVLLLQRHRWDCQVFSTYTKTEICL